MKSISVIVLMVLLKQYQSEEIDFLCDKFENSSDGTEADSLNEYCSVSNFLVNYTTQVKYDVYNIKHSSTVRVIQFFNSHMLYLPNGIFRYFPYVNEFDISNSKVIEIHRSSFEGATNLLYLNLSNNNINELGASTFIESTYLFDLDLSHNNISKINTFAFCDARSVSRLLLSYNKLNDLHENLFYDLHSLNKIFLNDNEIEIIHPLLFKNNVRLTEIYLDNNKLHKIDVNTFIPCKHLETLQFGGNFLNSFDSSTINIPLKVLNLNNNNLTELIVDNVMTLYASNNHLSSITLIQPDVVRALVLGNNSITDFENIFMLENIESLDLSFNHIGNVNISSFSKLKKLIRLNLGNTDLKGIDFGTFSSQTDLRVLDISYNNLEHINFDIFSPYLKRIEKILIEGNGLVEIADVHHIMNIFPSLNTIGLTNNFFNCTYLSDLLRDLAKLSVRLNLDPDGDKVINSTHVNGILCSNYFNRTKSIQPIEHHWLHGDSNYRTELNHVYNKDIVERSNVQRLEITQLKAQIMDTKLHESLLQSNLNFMKLLTVVICSIAFIYVSVKLVSLYLSKRNFPYANRNIFPSTTTMNTLQSQLETS